MFDKHLLAIKTAANDPLHQYCFGIERYEVSELWIPIVSAGLSGAGIRSFCKLMDMSEWRAYPGSGCFLPGSASAIAVQSVLCQAKGKCLAPCIVGSKKYA